eukprot:5971342-Pyramimonas_sp.AAC.1
MEHHARPVGTGNSSDMDTRLDYACDGRRLVFGRAGECCRDPCRRGESDSFRGQECSGRGEEEQGVLSAERLWQGRQEGRRP